MFLSTFSPVIFTLNKTLLLDTELDHFNLHQKVITSCKISYYYARPDFSGIRDTLQHWLGTSGFDHEKCRLACTQTLFYFSFRSFQRHLRACERSERARKKNKERLKTSLEEMRFIKFLLPPPLPPCAQLAVHKSPAVYILSPALDGLWRENRGSVSTNFIRFIFLLVSD